MKSIITLLHKELHVSTKHPLVLSVSGGIDSMSLFTMLLDSGYRLVVVHFNHQKRDESIIEKDLVETFSKKHNIPFHYYTIDVADGNFHHQAHLLRAHYLMEVARLYKTPYIVTAHHLDDLFENILMKLTRGSNLLGYAGMQMIHQEGEFTYIKPLLYTSKSELVDYATEHHILYLNDSSNEDNYYLRNRYRHAIVPVMKQENDRLLEQIKQYHLQLSRAFHFIRKTTLEHVPKDRVLDLDAFSSWDSVLQDDAIAYLIEYHHLPLTFDTVEKIKKMLTSSKPNSTYELGREYRFVKAYREAYVTSDAASNLMPIQLSPESTLIENVAVFTFSYNSGAVTEEFIKLCYNELAFPLWLRHRKDGDQLAFDYGHKKLKKLLIDLKIPMEDRQKLWVLTDSNDQILWVQHHYVNQTLGNDKTLYFTIKEDKKHAQ